jgi:hypothetical protein
MEKLQTGDTNIRLNESFSEKVYSDNIDTILEILQKFPDKRRKMFSDTFSEDSDSATMNRYRVASSLGAKLVDKNLSKTEKERIREVLSLTNISMKELIEETSKRLVKDRYSVYHKVLAQYQNIMDPEHDDLWNISSLELSKKFKNDILAIFGDFNLSSEEETYIAKYNSFEKSR